MRNKLLVALLLSLVSGIAWAAVPQIPLPVPVWERPIEKTTVPVQPLAGVQPSAGVQPPASVQASALLQAAAPLQAGLTPIPAQEAVLLHKVHGFVWGAKTAPAKAIVFIDPNCLWCHRFFEQVQAGVKAGKARYLMIPVAILKKSSAPKAERILQAKDPQAVYIQGEKGFDSGTEEGGLPQTFPHPQKAIVDIVAINTAVLADLEGGKPATPTFVVTTLQGPALHEGFVTIPTTGAATKAPVVGSDFRQGLVPVPRVRHIVMPPLPQVRE
ncbi:thioredoxin domain-containing protein [Acidithiobacillus ferriphilus]|uniref:thioredoxin domain-containing protein n=1 Tax=Acidithiobacillus ferriphilus TaxID=1689834 RepID=UPI001C0782CE|nr:thioredoxin domain-containing protein [Acidithiobacillus ferriphilus]MBU2852917.1 thioredoxin fold domain-containing protein [Acidithiobacillus ferriphilus]